MGSTTQNLTGASIGASALGSIAQGYSTAASDRANARIADINAQLATQNATFAAEEGEVNAGTQGMQNRAQAGSIRANQGASGITIGTGSNADVQASQAAIGQQNVMNIRSNAARLAYGYQTEAVGDIAQANVDRAAGSNAITAGYIGGLTKGATQLAGAYQQGTFGGGGSDAGGEVVSSPTLFDNNANDSGWDTKINASSINLNNGYFPLTMSGQ